MKKLTLGVLLVSIVAVLIGCHTARSLQEETLLPMAQRYRGVLPCADCSGIETSLFLEQDGTFVLKQSYQTDRAGNTPSATYGKWARTADRLVLTDTQGSKFYFRPVDKGLEMLDRDGIPLNAGHAYRLQAMDGPLPTLPMTMRGMYLYLADAAVFSDCFTGVRYPVVNNLALEKEYLRVHKAPEQEVLLTMEAHFAVVPSMEEGHVIKSVVPSEGPFTMDAQQRCEH